MNEGNSITQLVEALPGGPFYLTHQVALILGKSSDTIRRWRNTKGGIRPSKYAKFGELKVWLYTEQDLALLKMFVANVKPGRPRKD